MIFLILQLLARLQGEVVNVPGGNGNPVLIDGVFDADEWADARAVQLGDSVQLYVKEYRGHVFLGVRTPWSILAYTDLFIQTEPGVIYNLHASAQLGERRLTDTLWTDREPATAWGNSRDWYANENRVNRLKADSILRANPQADRDRMRFETTFPYDGYEFQIRRSRFPARDWRIRIEARSTVAGHGDVIYPAHSTRRRPESWATLRFQPNGDRPGLHD